MENAGYLLTAYTIVWAVVFGYILLLFNRQQNMWREINSLKKTLQGKREAQ